MTTPIGESQTGSFQAGIDHLQNPGRANVSSLTLTSQSWNAAVSSMDQAPHSVLEPLAMSANGMSAGDATHRSLTGEFLGSGDGGSAGEFGQDTALKFADGSPPPQ